MTSANPRRCLPEEVSTYLATEVCRLYGYTPVGWRFDRESKRWALVLKPREVPREADPV